MIAKSALTWSIVTPVQSLVIQCISEGFEIIARILLDFLACRVNCFNHSFRLAVTAPITYTGGYIAYYVSRIINRATGLGGNGKEVIRKTGSKYRCKEVITQSEAPSIGPIIWNVFFIVLRVG